MSPEEAARAAFPKVTILELARMAREGVLAEAIRWAEREARWKLCADFARQPLDRALFREQQRHANDMADLARARLRRADCAVQRAEDRAARRAGQPCLDEEPRFLLACSGRALRKRERQLRGRRSGAGEGGR